jgi:hypothetical protein
MKRARNLRCRLLLAVSLPLGWSALHAQPSITELTAVEFEDGQLGAVVASRNGTHHFVRITTRQQEAAAPLLPEAEVLFARSRKATATLVRRIDADERYIIGLYRCQYLGTASSAPRIATMPLTKDQPLHVVMDVRPASERDQFEPSLRRILTYTGESGGRHEARPVPATRGSSGAPVFNEEGAMVGITLEDWTLRDARVAVAILPITGLRELILGKAGTTAGAGGIPCEQFDLQEMATGRNTCEQFEHDAQQALKRAEEAQQRQAARQRQYEAQTRLQRRWERRMVQSTIAVAPVVGWGGGSEMLLRPTGGVDLHVMPDRLFQIHVRLQGLMLYGDRTYEDADAALLGFNRIRTRAQAVEGMAGFCLGKGDIYFGAMAGYGMELPATLIRTLGPQEISTVTAAEGWMRPVSQFDIGVQIAPVRLSLGFRTAHGAVPDIYKAQRMGLPWAFSWPAKDMPANGTMIVLEFSYRLWGWWNRDMKEHAEKEYYGSGGIDRPR